MASFNAAEDLVSILQTNISMAGVAALTNRPIIRRRGEDDDSGDIDSGELVIDSERYRPDDFIHTLRDEFYVCEGTYSYFMETTDTTLKQVLLAFDEVLRDANQLTNTRAYRYSMEYVWDTNLTQSTVLLIFTLIKEDVDLTA